ncbi:MAG: hypothetical protein AAGE94_22070 [Acidobacteriota bacterium]
MTTLVWMVIGAIAAVPFVAYARRHGGERTFAIGLVVAALIYIAFVVFGQASAKAVQLETIGAVAFIALAIAGRRSARVLAAGWGAHGIWDMAFHAPVADAYWPLWYPAACLGFDLVVAAHLGRVAREQGPA